MGILDLLYQYCLTRVETVLEFEDVDSEKFLKPQQLKDVRQLREIYCNILHGCQAKR